MKCGQCGAENRNNAKFCSKCGAKLSQVNVVKKSDKSINGNKSKILIVATVVIIIAIIVFTGFSLGMFNGDNQNNADESSYHSNGVNSHVNGVSNDKNAQSNKDSQQSKSSLNQDGNSKSSESSLINKDSKVSPSSFPVSEAPNLASRISGGSVTYEGVTYDSSQIAYIVSKSVVMIGSGDTGSSIYVGSYSAAPHPSGSNIPQTISMSQYLDMCNRFSSWMERNNQVPNYVGINTGGVPDVSPSKMIEMCIDILIQYRNTGTLPDEVSI